MSGWFERRRILPYLVRRFITRRLHDRGWAEHWWGEAWLEVPGTGEVDFVWCDGCGTFYIEDVTRDHEVE